MPTHTHTHIYIYRRTQTLNPPLRIGAPGNNNNELQWRTFVVVGYSTANQINDTAMAGVFNTVLTDISGNTLTSTATIDSVSLGDDGRSITCREISNNEIKNSTTGADASGNSCS